MSYIKELECKRESLAAQGIELRETTARLEDLGPFGRSLIVDDCPFCHGRHVHGVAPGELEFGFLKTRVADCHRGEYYGDIVD
jgi:hypothetical protein